MDRILIIWEKEKKNGPRASSVPILGLFSVIFKHVYWYIQQISGEPLTSGLLRDKKLTLHDNTLIS